MEMLFNQEEVWELDRQEIAREARQEDVNETVETDFPVLYQQVMKPLEKKQDSQILPSRSIGRPFYQFELLLLCTTKIRHYGRYQMLLSAYVMLETTEKSSVCNGFETF